VQRQQNIALQSGAPTWPCTYYTGKQSTTAVGCCCYCRNHHKYPSDIDRLVFPPLPACLPAAIIYGTLRACLPQVRPQPCALCALCLTMGPCREGCCGQQLPGVFTKLPPAQLTDVSLQFAGSCLCSFQWRVAGLCGIRLHALPHAQVSKGAATLWWQACRHVKQLCALSGCAG
jgi:hypothetical protein